MYVNLSHAWFLKYGLYGKGKTGEFEDAFRKDVAKLLRITYTRIVVLSVTGFVYPNFTVGVLVKFGVTAGEHACCQPAAIHAHVRNTYIGHWKIMHDWDSHTD